MKKKGMIRVADKDYYGPLRDCNCFGYLIIETFNEGNVFERRKRQNKKMLKENIVRKKISEFAVKR